MKDLYRKLVDSQKIPQGIHAEEVLWHITRRTPRMNDQESTPTENTTPVARHQSLGALVFMT